MTVNYGLYTDTAWSVPIVFKDVTGAVVNLSGAEFLADVISSSGAVVFRFKSTGGGATDGVIDKSQAINGILTFTASSTQHANIVAGIYRVHLKKDLTDDVWTSEGTMLVGGPGASDTYLTFDDPSNGTVGALVINVGGGGGGGAGSWGSITGTLSNQTDLQAALDAKQPVSADLTSIAGIAGTSGILKKSAAGSWALAVAGTDYVAPAGLSTYAPLASPTFTGVPAAPTAAADTNTTQLATTAYYAGQASATTPIMDGTATIGTSLKFARADHVHPTDTSRAPLASPTFTGVPAAPTAAVDTNTTQVATTAYVVGQASATAPVVDGTATVGVSTRFARADHVHPTDTSRAPLASPTFTGVPAAPTAAVDTNTTQVASTAFVLAQAAAVTPSGLGTAAVGTSTRFARADHVHAIGGATTQIQYNNAGALAGASGITTDGTSLTVTGQATQPVQTLTDGATVNWNCASGAKAKVTVAGNRTIAAVTNAVEGTSYTLWVIQDATGSRTLTWTTTGAGSFDFGTDGAPTLTTTASRADVLGFEAISIGGTLKLRFVGIKKGFA
jgi:hypothetical protein